MHISMYVEAQGSYQEIASISTFFVEEGPLNQT